MLDTVDTLIESISTDRVLTLFRSIFCSVWCISKVETHLESYLTTAILNITSHIHFLLPDNFRDPSKKSSSTCGPESEWGNHITYAMIDPISSFNVIFQFLPDSPR